MIIFRSDYFCGAQQAAEQPAAHAFLAQQVLEQSEPQPPLLEAHEASAKADTATRETTDRFLTNFFIIFVYLIMDQKIISLIS